MYTRARELFRNAPHWLTTRRTERRVRNYYFSDALDCNSGTTPSWILSEPHLPCCVQGRCAVSCGDVAQLPQAYKWRQKWRNNGPLCSSGELTKQAVASYGLPDGLRRVTCSHSHPGRDLADRAAAGCCPDGADTCPAPDFLRI
jgi:hypothetical protein